MDDEHWTFTTVPSESIRPRSQFVWHSRRRRGIPRVFFESNNSRYNYKTKQPHHPVQPSSFCWHVKSSKNSRKKSSATLAISLKHGAIVPALSFNEFLNPSAEVGVGGNFFSCVYPLPIAVSQKVEYWILKWHDCHISVWEVCKLYLQCF